MADRKALLRAVKDYEARGVPADICAGAGRIINKCEKGYAAKGLAFRAALKVVLGQPKFLTFTIQEPAPAAFIFFSYGQGGRRLFNRKVFDQLADYLERHGLTAEFIRLLEAEPFAG